MIRLSCASMALVACLLAPEQRAWAQPVLDHLIIVAPAAPGGGWDQTARALQHVLEADGLVRVVEVQNVAGAAGTIGLSQFISTGRGNGRALLVSGLVMLGATLWNASPVSLDQATPIARLTGEYEVVAVPASSPHRDLGGLVDAFRRRPEAVAWGGGSAGGTDHILAGLLAEAAGVDPRRVNYIAFSGGGEAVAALLGGHVTAGISGYSEFATHITSGRLRAIAISSPSRINGISIPTVKDQGLPVELVNWRAVLAAPGISAEDRMRLTTLVARATRSPRWRQILAEREWTDMYLEGEPFERELQAERERLVRVIARLRGPLRGTPVTAGERIMPIVVFTGAGLVLLSAALTWYRKRRTDGNRAPMPSTNRRAVAMMAAGLVAFVVLVEPMGFIIAATTLFVVTASAFRPALIRPAIVGAIFCALVYLAFTRGLDLLLPSGSLWAWMR